MKTRCATVGSHPEHSEACSVPVGIFLPADPGHRKEIAVINNVCFFEIPADDLDALKDFYSRLFDWQFTAMPGPWRYYQIDTGQPSPKGGLTARQDPDHGLVSYVKVEYIAAVIEKATALGAKVVVPKRAVKGIGWFSVLLDPQGNRIGLWEDDPAASA